MWSANAIHHCSKGWPEQMDPAQGNRGCSLWCSGSQRDDPELAFNGGKSRGCCEEGRHLRRSAKRWLAFAAWRRLPDKWPVAELCASTIFRKKSLETRKNLAFWSQYWLDESGQPIVFSSGLTTSTASKAWKMARADGLLGQLYVTCEPNLLQIQHSESEGFSSEGFSFLRRQATDRHYITLYDIVLYHYHYCYITVPDPVLSDAFKALFANRRSQIEAEKVLSSREIYVSPADMLLPACGSRQMKGKLATMESAFCPTASFLIVHAPRKVKPGMVPNSTVLHLQRFCPLQMKTRALHPEAA